jgi:hypothetical protein
MFSSFAAVPVGGNYILDQIALNADAFGAALTPRVRTDENAV